MLRIFTPVKIQRLRPGLNPRTWVPEASMLTARPPKPSKVLKIKNKECHIKLRSLFLLILSLKVFFSHICIWIGS